MKRLLFGALLLSCLSLSPSTQSHPIPSVFVSRIQAQTKTAVELSLPKEVAGDPGEFITIKATTNGKYVRWMVIDSGLNLFPVELLADSKVAVVTARNKGRYRLLAVTALADEVSSPVITTVVIGEVPPTPPGPTPPGPTPPGPTPPSPAPIPVDGFRVLIIYESADLPKYPAGTTAAMYSRKVREYMNNKCVKGTDGKTAEWRVWDKDVDTTNEAKHWQDAMKRERKSLPWVIISDGKTGYEGPMPDGEAGLLDLVKKYGG